MKSRNNNKTDYCDLTLQFRDNSQLKVHRLSPSACADYFNLLEQICEVLDDAVIMPIVNFMYTGKIKKKHKNNINIRICLQISVLNTFFFIFF